MNGRKARQRRRAQQTTDLRPRDAARIAGAVHEAVCAVTATDGFAHCALYAWVGAAVARTLTGRTYDLQAGRVTVGTGDVNDDGELYVDIDPDGGPLGDRPGGRDNGEYHAWMVARPRGMAAGRVVAADPRTAEVADLSLRHFPRHARAHGMPWARDDLPDFYWGAFTGLRDLRVTLTPDAATTYLITDKLTALDPLPAEATRAALRLLDRSTDAPALTP